MTPTLYTGDATDRERWNAFVATARQRSLLFDRNYMDYHADRFTDTSVMVADDKGHLVALLPATLHDGGSTARSHGGLTYGGLITRPQLRAGEVAAATDAAIDLLGSIGVRRLIYRPTPHIYHTVPSDEDLYRLWQRGATMTARQISTAIDLSSPHTAGWAELRRRGLRKAQREGIVITPHSDKWSDFWDILTDNLARRHGVSPVHTLAEITLLAGRFPDNIVLYTASRRGVVVAGVVVYLTATVSHLQYIAASPEGKDTGALDALMAAIIDHERSSGLHRYFDFGISTTGPDGRDLNQGLISQKEGFGGRAILYDTYTLDL